eukprot:6414425-Alexandrium_andersonii.AAC.1
MAWPRGLSVRGSCEIPGTLWDSSSPSRGSIPGASTRNRPAPPFKSFQHTSAALLARAMSNSAF